MPSVNVYDSHAICVCGVCIIDEKKHDAFNEICCWGEFFRFNDFLQNCATNEEIIEQLNCQFNFFVCVNIVEW